eukprot:1325354-Amorphochlora_amoeboformis.AAC.2
MDVSDSKSGSEHSHAVIVEKPRAHTQVGEIRVQDKGAVCPPKSRKPKSTSGSSVPTAQSKSSWVVVKNSSERQPGSSKTNITQQTLPPSSNVAPRVPHMSVSTDEDVEKSAGKAADKDSSERQVAVNSHSGNKVVSTLRLTKKEYAIDRKKTLGDGAHGEVYRGSLTERVRVLVPPGTSAGDIIKCFDPNGVTREAVVPPNCPPGSTFEAKVTSEYALKYFKPKDVQSSMGMKTGSSVQDTVDAVKKELMQMRLNFHSNVLLISDVAMDEKKGKICLITPLARE